MRGMLRVIILLLALIAVAALSWLIPLPHQAGPATGRADEKLVVISPHWDGLRNEFKRGFAGWYRAKTGRSIAIDYLDVGGTSDCVKFVSSEFKRSPSGIGVDLFFGGGTDPFLKLKKDGLLQRVDPDTAVLNPIPQTFGTVEIYDNDRFWFGNVLSGFGIVYNKIVVRRMGFAEPRQWKDLADPRYRSWVGAADPRSSGTMHQMFEIVLQAYGWDAGWRIITAIAANAKTFTKGAADVPKMVARGEVAFGLAVDFYGWSEVSEAGEDKVGMLLPQNLTVVSADAIAMLKGASNPAAAALFIEYTLCAEGQKLWFLRKGAPGGPEASELNRMSVRPDFYATYAGQTNVRQNPFATAAGFRFNHELTSKRWALINDLLGVAVIDNGAALRKAWEVADPSDTGWNAMPVDEAGCLRLIDGEWKDPVKKNRRLLEWQRFFTDKYAQLAQRRAIAVRH